MRALFLTGIFLLVPVFVLGADGPKAYEPLVGLPALKGSGGTAGLASYLNQLYMVTIAFGAIIAFIKIAMAGVQYSLTDIVTSKEYAKKNIQGALLGLAILLIPYTVLYTINPDLVKLNILELGKTLKVSTSPGSTGSGPGGSAGGGTTPPTDPVGGTTVRRVRDWAVGCKSVLADGGSVGLGTETYYWDCTLAEQRCTNAGQNATYVQREPERILCSYDEVITCTPGTDCPGDTGYVAP